MKRFASLLFVILAAIPMTLAQDASGSKASLQVQTGQKGADPIVTPQPKVPVKPTEPRVFYGGFLVDVTRGNKPTKPIDLRYPPRVRPVKDNVFTDPQTGAPKGFVFFAIKF